MAKSKTAKRYARWGGMAGLVMSEQEELAQLCRKNKRLKIGRKISAKDASLVERHPQASRLCAEKLYQEDVLRR